MKKPLGLTALFGAVVMIPAFVFSAMADLPHVFVVCLLLVAFSLLRRAPFKHTDRTVVYSALGGFVAAVALDYVFPLGGERFGLFVWIFRSNITAPAFLFIAAALTFFMPNKYTAGAVCSLSLTALLFGGELFFRGVSGEGARMPFLLKLSGKVGLLYGSAVVLEMILVAAAMTRRTDARGPFPFQAPRWRRRAVTLAILFLTALGAVSMLWVFRTYEGAYRAFENSLIKRRMMSASGGVVFGDEVNLFRTAAEDVRHGRRVVLRVVADAAPGYLRGRAYTEYQSGRWATPEKSGGPLSSTAGEGLVSTRFFAFPGSVGGETRKIDIFPASGFLPDVLFLPAASEGVELVTDKLHRDDNGVAVPEGWERDGGYIVTARKSSREDAFQRPSPPAESHTRVPPELRTELVGILGRALGAEERKGGDRKVVQAVCAFLRNNHQYSLEFRAVSGEDPVVTFLKGRGGGHCELFATSAALLLREAGIPARYVTGFVCEEKHPSRDYYVARLGNAHAWAEAYIRDEGRWAMVEATPATSMPGAGWGPLDEWGDSLRQTMSRVLAGMRRGYFADAVAEGFKGAALLLWALFGNLPGGFVLLAASAWMVFRRVRRRRAALLEPGRSKAMEELVGRFRRLEAALVRAGAPKRGPGETLREWADRLGADGGGVFPGMRELLDKYLRTRFSSSDPARAETDALFREMDAAEAEIRARRRR